MPEEAEKPGVDCNQYEDIDRETEFERTIFRFKDGDWTHKASLSANLPLFWNYTTPTEKENGSKKLFIYIFSEFFPKKYKNEP